jgi:uncharacterized protein
LNGSLTGVRAAVRGERREPFFFGSSHEQLFGCYHSPPEGPTRGTAVVLCYPFGQEYIRSHRSFVQLATRLALRGFGVLRFDYFGSGDSAGDSGAGNVARWVSDIESAVAEVTRRAATSAIVLVGLRLGALLAVQHACRRGPVDGLVLWDPLSSGLDYLEDLRQQQETLLRHAYLTPGGLSRELDEVLGFPVTAGLRSELAALRITCDHARPAARRTLLIRSESGRRAHSVASLFAGLAPEVEQRSLDEQQVWLTQASKGLVPHALVEEIVSWIAHKHE